MYHWTLIVQAVFPPATLSLFPLRSASISAMIDAYIHKMFSCCRKIAGTETWQTLLNSLPPGLNLDGFVDFAAAKLDEYTLPDYFPDLARLEGQMYQNKIQLRDIIFTTDQLRVNPTLALVKVRYQNLPELILDNDLAVKPEPGEAYILIWNHPENGRLFIRPAIPDELLALKIVVEDLGKRETAHREKTTLKTLDRAIERGITRGLLLTPASALQRDLSLFAPDTKIPEKYTAAHVFTLQWHITQTCDLSCKHCYDRSERAAVTLDEALNVLDQLYDFCQERHVYGQVSLSGGNPLLHPQFFEIYQAAADRGFMIAILGNPTTLEILSRLNTIQKPEFYQVSLEGLQKHNDYIRGPGFFDRVFRFLDDLRAADIYSMVMLTLTRDNMNQVLPLAEALRDKVDTFTFNRLSMVGEGAQLLTPSKEEYETFLRSYLEAEKQNPAMALKDNLINIIRQEEGKDVFGGCAGFGCGAAFNFVSLLPDGGVHACRKFPSPIGNILDRKLSEIYDSAQAIQYRTGPSACRGCKIRHVCGGCLAVINSRGLDITKDCDPCCFLEQ